MTTETTSADRAAIHRRRATTWARASAGVFACGAAYLIVAIVGDFSLWPLVGFAAAQATLGLGAAVLGVVARHDGADTPVGSIIAGITIGLIGAVGVPLWTIIALLAQATYSSGAGFTFGAWGRPLRIRGRIVHPEVRAGDEWAAGDVPDVASLSPIARQTLAAWWLRDAQKEHASVPAFARLAWQLTALGAPAALLERTYRAGLQEIDHARRCFALVSAYRGEPCGVLPMPELAGDSPSTTLVALATESLGDGCFIEDLNSDAAELALERARDPAVHALCATIARDERDHAALAWDIVAWCIARGGEPVASALRAAAAAIPADGGGLYDAELAQLVAQCDVADLHAHGRVPLADWPALYRARLAATRVRLAALLGDQGKTGFISRSTFRRSERESASSA